MSGDRIHINKHNNRREFLANMLGLLGMSAIITHAQSCKTDKYTHIKGSIVGANHKAGHILRDTSKIPAPTETIHTGILIAGGGIAGLSALRWLNKEGVDDIMMIELADKTGGNATYGQNEVSAYPWGAHYLPIPDAKNKELIDFLHEAKAITGFSAEGLPIYNEYHLCHDAEERLYINGHWQDGLIPHFGISEADKKQISSFMTLVDELRKEKDEEGKYYFDIPIANSSTSQKYKQLDNISFEAYLKQQDYTSKYLLWYLEYCCKDDYGANLRHTSAWAGLHYFASRRGKGANAVSSDILTWPEGNGYLARQLEQQCSGPITKNMLVYKVATEQNKVIALCYDVANNKSLKIVCDKILLCTPQYVNKHILSDISTTPQTTATYSPWIVANITLKNIPLSKGAHLSWDNVIYGSQSVGYVYTNHQDIHRQQKAVLTYYLPLTNNSPQKERQHVYEKDYNHWRKHIADQLGIVHPGIIEQIEHLDVWVWGHGMIRPVPGYIWGAEKVAAAQPIDNRIFFAHSDLSGISIFEEAFYQGIRAAKEIIGANATT